MTNAGGGNSNGVGGSGQSPRVPQLKHPNVPVPYTRSSTERGVGGVEEQLPSNLFARTMADTQHLIAQPVALKTAMKYGLHCSPEAYSHTQTHAAAVCSCTSNFRIACISLTIVAQSTAVGHSATAHQLRRCKSTQLPKPHKNRINKHH